jgi:carbon-monoxide dehydrogenase large subunit
MTPPLKPTRIEDHRLITGAGRFTADWTLPGQVHAYMVRSDRAHAEIVAIDVAAARAAPGVLAVLTHEDIAAAGFGSMPGGVSFEGRGGQKMLKPLWPPLARERVHFVGQPVAAVIAASAAAAADAAELVQVEYRGLAPVTTVADALRQGAPQLHAEVPGNLAFDYESGDAAAVAAAFASANHVSRLTLRSQRLVGNPMEPRACAATYDATAGVYTIYTPTQGVNGMRGALAALTKVPKEHLRIVAQDVGGSFGIRSPAYPEHAVVMAGAKRLGRPVKWVGTRSEVFLGDNQGRALELTGEIALDADGRILALRWDDCANLGAYATPFGAWVGTRNLTITMGGVYRIAALHGRARCVYTSTAPVSAYRGAGRPDIAFAIERLIDHAAAEHGFDRIALRRRNFVPSSAMPYTTANGTVYDSGDFAAVMDDALARAEWAGFEARRAEAAARGKLRGIGIATYLEAGGGGAASKDQVLGKFGTDGRITVWTLTQSGGQGHETSFAQIVADGLGVPIERVRIRASDPDANLVGSGTGGSRSLSGCGSACRLLAERIVEQALPFAADALEAAPEDLEYARGAFTIKGTGRSIGLFAVAERLADRDPHPLDAIGEGAFGATFPNGCHIAEVEIDPDTGATRVVRYTAVDDIGTVVSPELARGQVHGGVVQGAGQVFGEQAIYASDTGQLLTASFSDYPMPRAGLIERFEAHPHPVPTATNALGAKGVGESGCSGALPALANAMIDALRPLGIDAFDMPFTPARVWEAIAHARGRRLTAGRAHAPAV